MSRADRVARHRESRRQARRRARLARTVTRELALMQRARLAGLDPLTPVGELRYDLRAASRYDPLEQRAKDLSRESPIFGTRVETILATSAVAWPAFDTAYPGARGWLYDSDSIETYQRVVSLRGGK